MDSSGVFDNLLRLTEILIKIFQKDDIKLSWYDLENKINLALISGCLKYCYKQLPF